MADQNILLQKITALIREGNTAEVFKMLHLENLPSSKVKTLTVIEAAYNEMKDAEQKGLSSTDDIQIRKNRINNQLLDLFGETKNDVQRKASPLKYVGFAGLGLLLCSLAFWWFSNSSKPTCPSYSSDINNKILVLPFQNVGTAAAKPHVSLNKRINNLTEKNKLSAQSRLGKNIADDLANNDIIKVGKKCDIDLLVWGTYSSRADTIYLVLEYRFAKKPNSKNLSNLVALKDVTGLQKGQMVKDFDDAVMSLCGLIALREGDQKIAKKWFDKVKHKESADIAILKALDGELGAPKNLAH